MERLYAVLQGNTLTSCGQFRIPLRTAEQAATSEMKRTILTSDQVLELFTAFSAMNESPLLFLRSLLRVDLAVLEPNSAEPRLLYRCTLGGLTNEDLSTRRQLMSLTSTFTFVANVEVRKAELSPVGDCGDTASVEIETDKDTASDDEGTIETDDMLQWTEVPRSFNIALPFDLWKTVTTMKWVVSQRIGSGGEIGRFIEAEGNDFNKLLPWAGAAVQVPRDDQGNILVRLGNLIRVGLPIGHFFCALPLPIKSGFPVHVNCFFSVMPSRLALWTAEDVGADPSQVQWNQLLCEEVLPEPYVAALMAAIDLLHSPSERFCAPHCCTAS